MKKIFLFLFFLSGSIMGFSQTEVNADSSDTGNDEIFTFVEEMPQFPGGDGALFKYINSNLKYPQSAKDAGMQGKVFLSFIIKKTGAISNAEIMRGIAIPADTLEAKAAHEMNEEALRLVRSMPNWTPGKQNGKPVDVKFMLPLVFKLQ